MGGGDYSPATIAWNKRHNTSAQSTKSRANKWSGLGNNRRADGIHRRIGKSLFVDGLTDQTTHLQVKNAFASFGRILGVFVQNVKRKQRRSKFGFVRFSFDSDAEVAMRRMNGSILNGATINVSLARLPQDQHTRPRPTDNQWKGVSEWGEHSKPNKGNRRSTRKEWRPLKRNSQSDYPLNYDTLFLPSIEEQDRVS
ncbi:uncharacterized protein LOC130713377 [Lotus japonicus]|uniref:uncharacterized protein LOC130713377 n=1 Tax=Lotus japonicus TaxID=34305 RepID=UPI002589E6F1|nr:uncharacterized protein LOC130713377 [Lotus japonicus]